MKCAIIILEALLLSVACGEVLGPRARPPPLGADPADKSAPPGDGQVMIDIFGKGACQGKVLRTFSAAWDACITTAGNYPLGQGSIKLRPGNNVPRGAQGHGCIHHMCSNTGSDGHVDPCAGFDYDPQGNVCVDMNNAFSVTLGRFDRQREGDNGQGTGGTEQ